MTQVITKAQRQPLLDVNHLSLPRVGFDRLVFSAPQWSDYAAGKLSSSDFKLPLHSHFRLHRDFGPGWDSGERKGMYTRIAEFVPITEPSVSALQVRYKPRSAPVPAFLVAIRGTMLALLDVDFVEQVILKLSGCFGPMKVSEIEFTVDFPLELTTADQLHREFFAPRTRIDRHDGPGSWSWGSGKSGTRFRLYHKTEDGFEATRTECVLRRSALRRYRIDSLRDVRTTNWSVLLPHLFRFVEFRPSSTRDITGQQLFLRTVRTFGIKAALQQTDDRRWSRNRLRASPIQLLLDDQVWAFEQQLLAGCVRVGARGD